MWNFLPSIVKQALTGLGVALAGLLALLAYGRSKKRQGAVEASVEGLQKDTKKLEKAREAAYEEKRDVDGVSDSDLVKRLRSRDNDWGKL